MKILLILSAAILACLLPGCSGSDDGTSPVSKPGTPLGLSVDGTGLTSLTLSWDIVDSATGYKLYRSAVVDGSYTEVYSGAAAGFADSGLDYAATYYYQVTARNSGGESAPSPAVPGCG